MKLFNTAVGVAVSTVISVGGAFAQSANSTASSGSTSAANVNSIGQAQSSLSLTNEAATEQKTVPSSSAPAFSSGHPCGLATSAGLVVLGGGVTFGNTRVDEACLLAQMGERQAAMIMIAMRSKSACRALAQAGRISSQSTCAGGTGAVSTAASTGKVAAPIKTASVNRVHYDKCVMDDGKIKLTVKDGGQREYAIDQCKRKLGY